MRNRRKILVVGGNEAVLKPIKEVLSREKIQIVQVFSAEEALDLLGSQEFSAIVSELRMSGMNGTEFVRELSGWHNIGVVLVSNQTDENEWLEAINAGAADLISKPFTKDKILRAIGKAFKESLAAFSVVDEPAFEV